MPRITNHNRIFPIWFFIVLFTGCVTNPRIDLLVSQQENIYRPEIATPCDAAKVISTRTTSQAPDKALNKNGFNLVVWNMFKGARDGWQTDLERLLEKSDLVVIQEAYLTNELQVLLETRGMVWGMVPAFELNGIPAGVLTASHVHPAFLCALKTEESLVKIPKGTLIARYPVHGTEQSLVIVNLHLLNFTLDLSGYQNQLTRIDKIVSEHIGPIVFAGDFNSWSDERLDAVEALIKRKGLRPVQFEDDIRTRFFGHVVDHVYYRHLDLLKARVIPVISSDHHPMVVQFAIK